MKQKVFSTLTPVRRRQRWQFAAQMAMYGLWCSAAAGILWGLWTLLSSQPVPTPAAFALLAAGPVLGLTVALLRRWSWQSAAGAVDEHYRLKDRTLTALEFVENADGSTWRELQIEDASRHLDTVRPGDVAPWRVPRILPWAAVSLAAAIVLLVWPRPDEAGAEPQPPHQGLVNVADRIEEDFKRLQLAVEQEQDEELKDLLEKLRDKVEEMKQPGVDVKEALAKISEMQSALQKQQAQYNEGVVDAQLNALGAALLSAEALEGAGRELQEGDFDKAAEKLEQIERVELKKKESKAVSRKMKQVAKSMGQAGLGQISDAVSETADGIESGSSGKISKGSRRLARHVRGHGARKRLNTLLALQLKKLNECKSLCQACQSLCPFCAGNCQGGNCKGGNNSLARGLNPQKSTSPSQSFGMGTSGNLFGEKTGLASKKNLETLTGDPGDGPSDIETTTSPEGRQQAVRRYREVHQEYQKLSEAVLESEPIPLGQRQMIRRYFELIRPGSHSEQQTGK